MKVALATIEGGGTASVCYGLANSLSKNKVRTTVFTDTRKKHEIDRISDFLTIDRLRRFELPPRFFWFQVQNLRYLLDKYSTFDLIHGVFADSSTMVSFYKKKLKKPYIVSFHAEPIANAKDFLKSPIRTWTPQDFTHQILELPLLTNNIKRCSQQADYIVLCSNSAFEEYKAAYNNLDFDKISVIQNAVNLHDIDRVEITKSKSDDEIRLIFAGRLVWVKGLMCLLQALILRKKDFNKVRLDIYGKGPEESRLKKFVSSKNLEDMVYFRGNIPHEKLIAELKKADIVVFPSFHEAQSMFVLESMACKKTIVAFNIPSMREIIIDGKTGLLAKAFEPSALAEKIQIAIEDTKLRRQIGENAYVHIKEKHDWSEQVKKYINVYNKCAQHRS